MTTPATEIDPDLAEWLTTLLAGTGLTVPDAIALAHGTAAPPGLEALAGALADGWRNGDPLISEAPLAALTLETTA